MFNPAQRMIWPVLIAAALALLFTGLALAAPAGTVVGLSGACFVESDGARHPLSLGQPVEVSDTLDVPADGRLKLRMSDGSVISIASGTRMTVAAYSVNGAGQRQQAQLSLASGLMRAVVAVAQQPSRFEVDTATGVAAVRSTDWFVAATPTSTAVSVLDGTVALTGRAHGREVLVSAHSGSEVYAGHPPLPPHTVRQAAFDALIAQTSLLESHLGWCQCIANHNAIQSSCVTGATACQTACASTQYSFIPAAPYSCGLEHR